MKPIVDSYRSTHTPHATAARFIFVAMSFAASMVLAAELRWTFEVGQGFGSATIRNEIGSTLSISCGHGHDAFPVSMNLETEGVRWRAREVAVVEIVVDGSRHQFTTPTGYGGMVMQFEAKDRAAKQRLRNLLQDLIRSRQTTFVIQFPQLNHAEHFPLRDARKALSWNRGTILDDCIK